MQRLWTLFSVGFLMLLALGTPFYQVAPARGAGTDADLQAMLRKIISVNKLNIPTQVVDASRIEESDAVNAYTDGQRVIITRKLWNSLPTNDARAFVLGHELGHITNGHITKGAFRSTGISILGRLLGAASGNQAVNYASQLGADLLNRKFSRNQEYESDDSGMQYILKSGYKKEAPIQVFRTLKNASGRNGQPAEFLSTHPIPDSRIDRIALRYNVDASGIK
jgi:predicted Zn-dependent protease